MNFLCEAIAAAQLDDPFAPVTVVVPSPYVRVQLRREVGLRRGLCNVSFRTWGEVTSDLARSGSDLTLRIPSPRTVNESLRQVLRMAPGPFESFARSPVARAELVALFQDLWRVEPTVLRALSESGGRVASLIETLHLLDDHLDAHGFTNLGQVLDLAALGAGRGIGGDRALVPPCRPQPRPVGAGRAGRRGRPGRHDLRGPRGRAVDRSGLRVQRSR